MRLVSWNVNGFRACVEKGFWDSILPLEADMICLQEIKLSEGQYQGDTAGYKAYWNYAEKKGYSGTAIFTRQEPLSVVYGIGLPEYDCEGRTITLEFEDFYLVNAYVPNAQRELTRLDFRIAWEDALRDYLCRLDQKKCVVYTGDLNVAHQEIDLKNPSTNHHNAGFTDEERGKFTQLLEAGFIDSFRTLYPDLRGAYSWWSYIRNARATNAGWRIDYFVLSRRMRDRLIDARIHADIFGSDHCPVSIDLR